MKTKQEIINELKLEFPTLRVGNDDNGYNDLSAEEYETTIAQWAEGKLDRIEKTQAIAEAKVAAQAKLAALGLTVEDLQALGL